MKINITVTKSKRFRVIFEKKLIYFIEEMKDKLE